MKILRFLFILLFPLQAFCQKTELLFLVQDAGETNAFLPFMMFLEEKKISFEVLAGGTGEEILKRHSFLENKVTSLHLDKSLPRDKKLSNVEIQKILSSFSPKRLLSGVAFDFQGQLMEAFQKKGVKTFAFWDSFSDNGDNAYFITAHEVEKKAETLLLPSQIVKNSSSFQGRRRDEMVVVGQPSLSFWQKGCTSNDWTVKLALPRGKKLFAYVGGYGKDYEEAFFLFLEMLSKGDFSNCTVLVLPHPKTDGSFENMALQNASISINIQVMPGIPTSEIAKVSDLVLCHQSTVGMQALAIPKPVLFIMPKDQVYSNFLIDRGWVKRLSEEDSLENEVQKVLSSPPPNLYSLMGIPENAEEKMYEAIFGNI